MRVHAVAPQDDARSRASCTRPVTIRTGINRRRHVNLFDPEGTRVELMEDTVDGKPIPSSTLPPPDSANTNRELRTMNPDSEPPVGRD